MEGDIALLSANQREKVHLGISNLVLTMLSSIVHRDLDGLDDVAQQSALAIFVLQQRIEYRH